MKTVTDTCTLLLDPTVKRRRVRLLVTIVLVGTVAAIAYHYMVGFYFGLGYPQSTFLYIPDDHFNDWDNPYIWAQAYLHGEPTRLIYFPFAFMTAVAATVLPMRVGFALVIALFLVVLVLMLRSWVVDCEEHVLTKVQYGFILVVLSYPVIFALDRTNLEMLLFVFIAAFFYFLYVRGSPWLAALFLGAAIAFKLYPATLLLLLLAERRLRTFVWSIVFALVLTGIGVVALAALGHHGLVGILRMNQSEMGYYQRLMVISSGGLQHGHSLWGLLRMPGFLRGTPVAGWQMSLYPYVAALIFLALAVYVLFFETERWKRVLFAMVPAVLLPFVSADYTLLQMYFPLVFFLNASRVSRWDIVYVALFGVLLVPVDYRYLSVALDGVSISVVIYPVALLALLVLAIVDRQRSAHRGAGESLRAA